MDNWNLFWYFHRSYFLYFAKFLIILFIGSCTSNSTPDSSLTKNRPWTILTTNGEMPILEKIWLHRTNHPDKFKKYVNNYSGFELDVNINIKENYFEVYHQPDIPSGIDFSTYLSLDSSRKKYFWLDFKNLDLENAKMAIRLLNQFDQVYKIKNRVLIESTKPDALKIIRKAGYNTVFYLSYPKLNGKLNDTVYLQWLVSYWDDQLLAISADAKYIPLLNTYLPATKKLTWCTNPLRNSLLAEKKRMILQTSVLIVLEKR